ncbi:hypothetical protein ACOMICROBIO_FLGHMIGD_02922 [Vibrio sp. B1FLJ16]|nr:hypothetical protein ACOMICROBIO_FLGHMIGD_02922 [Vibrio sp. B1FLJ16]CAE6947757.1 hypothetical protein ACOMICROBIO_FLGHMIGD_02922 [Vibrio sp. B1FLJ16]
MTVPSNGIQKIEKERKPAPFYIDKAIFGEGYSFSFFTIPASA